MSLPVAPSSTWIPKPRTAVTSARPSPSMSPRRSVAYRAGSLQPAASLSAGPEIWAPNPLPVERQIVIIYAGNRGYLDEFPVNRIREYEQKLYVFMDREHPDILARIAEKKAIDSELDEAVAAALQEFGRQFKSGN